MIRKTVNIFMSLVFLISTMGFTVSKHYCSNELVDFSINFETESCCDMEGGCCHNENEHFQLQEEFLSSIHIDSFEDIGIDLLFTVYFLTVSVEQSETVISEIEYTDISPPKIQTSLSLLQTYLC